MSDYEKTAFIKSTSPLMRETGLGWGPKTTFIEATESLMAEAGLGSGCVGAPKEFKPAIKHDLNKVPLELLSPIALTKVAEVLQFGARKYESHNWRKGMKWSRIAGAALRHLLAWLGGEDIDPESGLSHLAHAGCCIMFLLEYETTHKALDDRYQVKSQNET